MATIALQHPYQCDQCGTQNIVAFPVVYQEGTRVYHGLGNQWDSRTHSAHIAAPPQRRRYVGHILLWGFAVILFSVTGFFDLTALVARPRFSATETAIAIIFLLLWLASVAGMVRSLGRIARYNREVYPQLLWDWEHTYLCRRCGKSMVIRS